MARSGNDHEAPPDAAADTLPDAASAPHPGAGDATLPLEDETLRSEEPATSRGEAPPVRERFGKFEVLEKLGAGGMGVVLAAYDPDLDRKVAIKVLRTEAASDQGRARLLREARALAHLSHPNVITVHEVGAREGQIFMVMEHVDGGTLRSWVESTTRSFAEILAAYLAAGEGLAAAHAAGLVHRDFKPENVLVRSDGRVLVTDFGLVGAADAPAAGTDAASAPTATPSLQTGPSATPSILSEPLTRTGAVMGTPLYMAPEQHCGDKVDARADQFAFCVSLYQALYGQAPFAGNSIRELHANVLRGKPRDPPAQTPVPAWIHAVLLRGLRTEPADRHPDMPSLLSALRRDPRIRRRRRWLIAGVGLGATAACAAILTLWPTGPRARCRAAGDPLEGVWSEAQRGRVREIWSADPGYAERLTAAFDRYGELWKRERVAACQDTYLRGDQSEELLDRRLTCLNGNLEELRAAVQALTDPASSSSGKAMDGAVLPGFEECRDGRALRELMPVPPRIADAVKAERAALSRVTARMRLGELEEAVKLGEATLRRIRELRYPPLEAQALYDLGVAQGRTGKTSVAEEHLREATRLAAGSRAHHLEARAWLSLLYLVGYELRQIDRGLDLAAAAEAAVARASGARGLRAQLDNTLGLILFYKGDYRAAAAKLRKAIEGFSGTRGGREPDLDLALDLAITRNNLAMVLEKQGGHREALRLLQQVLEARERLLGPRHPMLGTTLNDLGNSAHSLGDLAAARRHLERSLAIRERALGKDHPRTADTLNNLAVVLGDLGERDRAIELARRSLAISEASLGKNHAELAAPLNTLGDQLRARGLRREAWEAYARGLANIELGLGREHISVAAPVENLARILLELGQVDRSLEFIDRAIAVRRRVQGEAAPETLNAIALRGSFNLEAKRHQAAIADFERQRALAGAARGPQDPETASAEYNLAVALERAGQAARAAEGYRTALRILEEASPRHRLVPGAWRGLGDLAMAHADSKAAALSYARAVSAADAGGHPVGDLLHLLGGAQLKAGRAADAVATLERAVQVRAGAGDVALLGLATFELAGALWETGRDRPRAVSLARTARERFVAAGQRARDNVVEVDAWLRRRGAAAR